MNKSSRSLTDTQHPYQHWDIFCHVIDHYGDVGISWRLACQLAREFNFRVRLWIDQLAPLVAICPNFDATIPQSFITLDGSTQVEICHWRPTATIPALPIADVVICAFGCLLPDTYLAAMQDHQPQPYWYNLEYLTTEKWVDHYHGLDSQHPRFALQQRFFFPGFSKNSGGLIREKNLIEKRQAWQADTAIQQTFKKNLGLSKGAKNERYITVFCYPTPALISLFKTWTSDKTPTTVLIPADQALVSIKNLFGKPLTVGCLLKKGSLTLKILPFTSQDNFDHLLWLADLNIVRGEDSFIRALWAAKPILWHIYPQAQHAHLDKLEAFNERYSLGLHKTTAKAWRALQYALNCHQPIKEEWSDFASQLPVLAQHAKDWVSTQQQDDIATQLVRNVMERCKIQPKER